MSGPVLAKRTARTAAWALLAGLVVGRFVDGLVPLAVQALAGVGAAVGVDWSMRWREGARERDEATAHRRDRR